MGVGDCGGGRRSGERWTCTHAGNDDLEMRDDRCAARSGAGLALFRHDGDAPGDDGERHEETTILSGREEAQRLLLGCWDHRSWAHGSLGDRVGSG